MHPDIVVVVLDTARAQTVFSHMEAGKLSSLSAIAAAGTTFTETRATAPWTMPSHASIFTGQYTADHQTHAGTRQFEPVVPSLADALRREGYRTAGISANPWLSPELGFDEGFEYFSMAWDYSWHSPDLSLIPESGSLSDQLREVASRFSLGNVHRLVTNSAYAKFMWDPEDDGARRMTDKALEFFHADRSDPSFLFLNYMEPHLPYDPPAGYLDPYCQGGLDRETIEEANQDAWAYVFGDVEMSAEEFHALEALYRAELDYLDDQLGRLVAGLDERTAVIVTADHGENLGEHGLMDHQYNLYDTLLHVPLIARHPPTFPAGERVASLVELRDIYPTVLDLAGVPMPVRSDVSTNSLTVTGDDDVGRDHAIAEYHVPQPPPTEVASRLDDPSDRVKEFDRALASVRTQDWKLIRGSDGMTELYNIRADPDERSDVGVDHPDLVASLDKVIQQTVGPPARTSNDPASLSRRSEKRLQELGYLE